MDTLLANDVAVVTGGASGIGRAISLKFAKTGADVVVSDIRENPRSDGKPTHEKINTETNSAAKFVKTDVTNVDDVFEAVDASSDFGELTIMVNNAGMTNVGDFLTTTEDEYDELMNVNVKGVFFGSQAAGKQMNENDRIGSIINISSISGIRGRGDGVRYCASKAAVQGMTYAMADRLGPMGIRVNAILPGVIKTAMTVDDAPIVGTERGQKFEESVPRGRIGVPEDVANTALYLASDLSDYVTAESFLVDGGTSNTR